MVSVALGGSPGYSGFIKYGHNEDVDGPEDIWNGGGDYTGFNATQAQILVVVSTSVNDLSITGTGARKLALQGLDANYLEVFDTVDLNGLVSVSGTVAMIRLNRAEVVSSGSAEHNDGDLTVTQLTSGITMAVIPAGRSQTHILAYTVPGDKIALVSNVEVYFRDSNTNGANIDFLLMKDGTDTWLHQYPVNITNGTPVFPDFKFQYVLPPRSDFKVRCASIDNANGKIAGKFIVVLKDTN